VHGPGGFFGSGTPTFDGGYNPGASPAEVTFESGVILGSSNLLTIELGGLDAGSEFDVLTIEGVATLAGAIDVDLIDGFEPSGGDTFEILTAGDGVRGTFAVELLPDLGGLQWDVSYGANNVVLEVVSPFSADFDLDGDVDGDDLAQWQGDYGGPGSDADGDGDSDGTDLLAWQRQLTGEIATSQSASSAIPEPASLLLIWLSSAVLCGIRLRGCCT